MEYFDKTYHPPGTSPGTLIGHAKVVPGEFTIHLIDYTATDFIEKELATTDECQAYLEKGSVTWIHMHGPIHEDTIKNIGETFDLNPLAMEDVLNKGQRPKVEEYDNLLFVIMAMPAEINGTITIQQVSLFIRENYIISFYNDFHDPFEPIRNRIRKAGGRIRQQKTDYLLYSILDLVIDQGYPVLESFGDDIEAIEDELLSSSAINSTLVQIQRIRRELLLLRRKLWPQREVINNLLRSENMLITQDTIFYLRDCYDHSIQILELIENYQQLAANLIDIYQSSTSQRLNEIMRVLTMIATIFIPITFVVGLYGMNFSHPDSPWAMPELHWYFGYPMVWGIMIAIVIGMVIYFKRKNWL